MCVFLSTDMQHRQLKNETQTKKRHNHTHKQKKTKKRKQNKTMHCYHCFFCRNLHLHDPNRLYLFVCVSLKHYEALWRQILAFQNEESNLFFFVLCFFFHCLFIYLIWAKGTTKQQKQRLHLKNMFPKKKECFFLWKT